jgi:hypothetical protein
MKALTTFLIICLFSFTINAQETEEKNQSENQKERNETTASKYEGESQDKIINPETETKSFTLDANDAVVEEMELSEPYEVEEIYDGTGRTTYHYSNHRHDDDIQTLGGSNGHHGGFGAISFKASEFNNKDIIMAGFRGGWIINRAMAIGFEGHGIIPTAEYQNIDPNNSLKSRSVGGYGGMFLEPIILSNKVVHVTFPVSGGGGWLGYIVDWEQTNNYKNDLIDDDIFWYVEPGAAIELNVARNFRINLGASYRFTKDLDLMSTASSGFDAWNYCISLKFGSF